MYNYLIVEIVLMIWGVVSTFIYACTGVVYIFDTLVRKLAISVYRNFKAYFNINSNNSFLIWLLNLEYFFAKTAWWLWQEVTNRMLWVEDMCDYGNNVQVVVYYKSTYRWFRFVIKMLSRNLLPEAESIPFQTV